MVKNLTVTRVLHAGYIFECADKKIIFDPIFENPFSFNCYAYPDVEFDISKIKQQQFDAVFISHYHDDHCSFESLNLISKETPIYMYCLVPEMFELLTQLGFKNVHSLRLGKTINVGDLRVTPHRALDHEVDCIFQISNSDINVLNVVDSWIDHSKVQELSEINWDLILWPFQTMREVEVLSPRRYASASKEIPHEWIEQLGVLNPKNIIPSSCQFINENWSWYNKAFFPISYTEFAKQITQVLPQINVFKLNPGKSVLVTPQKIEIREDILNWIKLKSAQDVDYDYRPQVSPMSLSEIALKLNKLNRQQSTEIESFCIQEIPKRLSDGLKDDEFYFSKNRFWRLKVYDGNGISTDYVYSLTEGICTYLDKFEEATETDWLTEITAYKLWSALNCGESLTSLYLRVNGNRQSDKVEEQLQSADPIEDPLVKCLYNGLFAAYQKYQLEKIRTTVKF